MSRPQSGDLHEEEEEVKWADVVVNLPNHVPAPLVRHLVSALDELKRTGPLFCGKRDDVWTDVIDPELCLAPKTQEHLELEERQRTGRNFRRYRATPPKRVWQSAEARVTAEGGVCWASWVNHLNPRRDAAVLEGLRRLVQLAVPHLERVSGAAIRGSTVQLVVGAFEHCVVNTGDDKEVPISDWHIDGSQPEEKILATATSYLEVSESLQGGAVEFAPQCPNMDARGDHPQMRREAVASGTMLVFNNGRLRHRVVAVRGSGRRLLVALHMLDPKHPQHPLASSMPRQLESQASSESLRQVALLFARLFPGRRLPSDVAGYIWSLTRSAQTLTVQQVMESRDDSRLRRLYPGSRGFPGGTGIYTPDRGPLIGGTGLAEHTPSGLFHF